jgi:hypothetical protein
VSVSWDRRGKAVEYQPPRGGDTSLSVVLRVDLAAELTNHEGWGLAVDDALSLKVVSHFCGMFFFVSVFSFFFCCLLSVFLCLPVCLSPVLNGTASLLRATLVAQTQNIQVLEEEGIRDVDQACVLNAKQLPLGLLLDFDWTVAMADMRWKVVLLSWWKLFL